MGLFNTRPNSHRGLQMAALRERLAALPWNDPLRPAIVAQLQDLRRGRVDIIEPEDGVRPRMGVSPNGLVVELNRETY